MHYQLACYTALDGRLDEALQHLRLALSGDPRSRKCFAQDTDLDALRDRPDWPG